MSDTLDDRALAGLCERLGQDHATLSRFADGSLPVYALGSDLLLKLYPPDDLDEWVTEIAALKAVETRLPVPTPRVVRTGEVDGWSYVLMSRLAGESLTTVWPRMFREDRTELALWLGRTIAALHASGGKHVENVPRPGWREFLATQRKTAVERQRSNGLDETWLAQIPSFLDSIDDDELECREPVLLHTEIMREHLLMSPLASGWLPTGLLDFEPAMLGAAEYEFVAVGLFVSRGDAGFLRQLLLAYGYRPDQLDTALARSLLAYTLLHRYSNLRRYLSALPAPPEPTLDSLATCWFGTTR